MITKKESFLMKQFRRFGMDSIAWSLRRLYCPVEKGDLVLEVGSGSNPYFRANVLCDAYFETQERFFVPLIHDRPTIIALAENLPFKDNAFDFIIASHVLEHSANPKKFLEEIQRVGKAGYIEVPDAFMERLTHYGFHRLEITDIDDVLVIRKKKNHIQDKEVVDLFKHKARPIFLKWAERYPFQFHVRYYWSKNTGGIKYNIINPEYEFDWDIPTFGREELKDKFKIKVFLKTKILLLIRKLFSQNKRNSQINILNLMLCGKCQKDFFAVQPPSIICKNCSKKYFVYGLKKQKF